jgi:hypothetical protein
MSDIIREVDEEMRREQMLRFWRRYGGYIAGVAILIVAGVGGWRGYEYYAAREADRASVRFFNAQKLAADPAKSAEAIAAFKALEQDGTYAYRMLSRFALAAEAGKKNPQEGAAAFDAIAADTGIEPVMRDVARIRAAQLLVDTAGVDDVKKRLEPLLAANANFVYSAKELLALSHVKAGQNAEAQKLFLELAFDPQTPPGVRQRAQVMQVYLFGGTPVQPAAQTTPPTQ